MLDLLLSILVIVIKIMVIFVVYLLGVAYLTWLERKIIGHMQIRYGPTLIGPHGLLLPIADGLKLFLKEDIIPAKVDKVVYLLAPFLSIIPASIAIAVIPFGKGVHITDLNIGIFYILAITSLGIYGTIFAGWSSNSKYSMIGGLRSAAQVISYEVPLIMATVGPLMMAGSLSTTKIVSAQQMGWFLLPQLLGFAIYVVAAVAETNRFPFDMPEAESELVAGFMTEYGGMKFAYFFIAEYGNMITVGAIATMLFLGGWQPPLMYIPVVASIVNNFSSAHPIIFGLISVGIFVIKLFLIIFFFLWIRATYPRFRYDQVMRIGWKILLPLSLINIGWTGFIMWLKIDEILKYISIFVDFALFIGGGVLIIALLWSTFTNWKIGAKGSKLVESCTQ